MPSPHVTRLDLTLDPDPRRVLLRPFIPSLIVKPSNKPGMSSRIERIYSRVMMLSEEEAEQEFANVMQEFDDRHHSLGDVFLDRFDLVSPALPMGSPLSQTRQKLLGAYFTNEYSLESAALFNPSIVPHPDQSGMKDGDVRVVVSVRATGEGHISSVGFHSGVVTREGEISLDKATRYVVQPIPLPAATYDRGMFARKLRELGADKETVECILKDLPDQFTMDELHRALDEATTRDCGEATGIVANRARLLAESNYTVRFKDGTSFSERVLFPYSASESNGIEDARFVKFDGDGNGERYFATYTAYDGREAFPQMVETRDFLTFRFSTLNGSAVANKGLALFPRPIDGRYVMLGRQDSENIHIMFSDDPYCWSESKVLLKPKYPWEFVQLGNCGSPIETEHGWLVLTHGVGAMRKYSIGVALLDLDDPSKVIARGERPLLGPQENEREGYVPNVVYSCGGMKHGDYLILPYAVSDSACRFARVDLKGLLAELIAE